MEVHHHSSPAPGGTHTARKKWTHYFWEFLMLFLAVFCGFMAEYQLEHVIENQREKKYATSLLEDLINDTLDLNNSIPYWQTYNSRIDTIRNEIEEDPLSRDPFLLYRCVSTLQQNNIFLYHDRTIGQLKYSGNFRIIRRKVVADSLIEYDAHIMIIIKDIQDNFNILSHERRESENQLFNSKFFNLKYNKKKFDSAAKKEPQIFAIRTGKEDILIQYYNSLYALRLLTVVRISFQKVLLKKAITLIGILKKEYHLK